MIPSAKEWPTGFLRPANSGNIEYIYDAMGTKLAQKVGSSLTYYRGPFIYEGDNLKQIFHPEGTVNWSGRFFTYYYFKTDPTGSTRATLLAFGDAGSGNWELRQNQSTDYYPFGQAHSGFSNLDKNRYLYSGKELQNASVNSDGSLLGLYDFGDAFNGSFNGMGATC